MKKQNISHAIAHRLVNGEMKSIQLDHTEKLCTALNCTPNDLLKWTPDEDVAVDKDHPLYELQRRESIDLLAEIKDLPLDKLRELQVKLDELEKQ